MKKDYKIKCDFCKYYSGKTCMTKESSYYCHEALQEFYAFLANKKQQKPIKTIYKRRG